MKIIFSHRILGTFLLCGAIAIFTQFMILQPILRYSLFTPDDWMWLFNFRSLHDLSFFEKVFFIWKKFGIHEGGYAVYMGILGEIFGNNYSAYQYFNVTLKIISTLTLFPLILILFRNRLLAFLTTLIYGINSASIGSFYWYMKGGIFPAVAFMNLFFISYYYTLLRKSKVLLLLSSVLILFSYMASPTRIFPIFLVVVGVEVYWLLKHKGLTTLKNSFIRLICLLLPSILIAMQVPVSPNGRVAETPLVLLNQIVSGNWFNLLSPLAGIGYSLLTVENMKIFGSMDLSTYANLPNYLSFLLKGSIWIFLFSSIFFAVIISRKTLRFIITAFTLNFILDILIFYIARHHFFIPIEKVQYMDPSLFFETKFPTLVAIFILVIAFMTFLEWLKEKRNYLLLAVSIGPIFSLIFLVSMWITLGYLLDGYNSIHYYHQIPAIGISLFFAAILSLFYGKFKNGTFQLLALVITVGIVFSFYSTSSFAINREFLMIYHERVEVKDQQILHDKLMGKLGNLDRNSNLLVYFQLPKDSLKYKYYERALLLDSNSFFAFMINWRRAGNDLRCIGNITDIDTLKYAYSLQNGRGGFILDGRCNSQTENNVFYSIDSFYAYKMEDSEFVDIKDTLLGEFNLP